MLHLFFKRKKKGDVVYLNRGYEGLMFYAGYVGCLHWTNGIVCVGSRDVGKRIRGLQEVNKELAMSEHRLFHALINLLK